MPYTIHLDLTLGLVEVVHSAQTSVATRLSAMEEGAQLLRAHQLRRVLVDLRDAISAPDAGDIATTMTRRVAQAPLVAGSRLAYLMRPHQHANLLAENMAAARHDQHRHFTAREDALRWLLSA